MKAQEIKKIKEFIDKNNIEWRWDIRRIKNNRVEEDVIVFPYMWQLEAFIKSFYNDDLFKQGIKCTIRKGYVAIWMSDILSKFDIELEEIFPETNFQHAIS